MPQGKLKVKAKLPVGVQKKAITKKKDIQKKNRPAPPKKSQNSLRETITKSINEHIEVAAKERANLDGIKMKVAAGDEKPGKSSKPKS